MTTVLIFLSFFIVTPVIYWLVYKIEILIRYGAITEIEPALFYAWRRNSVKFKDDIHYILRQLVEDAVESNYIDEKIFRNVAKDTEIRIGKNLAPDNPNNVVAQAKQLPKLYWKLKLCRKHLVVLDQVDIDTWLSGGDQGCYSRSIAVWILHELIHRYLEEKVNDSDHNHTRQIWKLTGTL